MTSEQWRKQTMGLITEFKAFAMKGNVMDLAIAVNIGGAFQKIVASVVNDILMPIIGILLGGLNFSQLYISLNGQSYATLAEAEKAGAGVIKYGSFIQVTIDFLIVAFVIFLVVKLMNARKKPAPPAAPPETPEDIQLLRQIRDSLKK
jgi:large conductance mechanosensitive channel